MDLGNGGQCKAVSLDVRATTHPGIVDVVGGSKFKDISILKQIRSYPSVSSECQVT